MQLHQWLKSISTEPKKLKFTEVKQLFSSLFGLVGMNTAIPLCHRVHALLVHYWSCANSPWRDKSRCSKGQRNHRHRLPQWYGRLVCLCIWPHFILCCRLLALQENASSAWDFNTKPLSPPTLFACLGKVKSGTCWRRWFITEWKECQNSTIQKLSFLHILNPSGPDRHLLEYKQCELPDLTDSWVATQGKTGPSQVESEEADHTDWQKTWVFSYQAAHTQADGRWHPFSHS